MNNVLLIARREYLERIRGLAFRISTVILPLAVAAFFGIASLSVRGGANRDHIVVASNDPLLAQSTAAELPSKGNVEVRTLASGDLAELNRDVQDKSIDGYLWLDAKPGAILPDATYASRDSGNLAGNRSIRDAIGRALVREELLKRNVPAQEAADLLKDVDLKTERVAEGQALPSNAGRSVGGAYGMAMLLYVMVLFYGVNAAQSVGAEKTSRVFEVMLASAEPRDLMAGKLLGVGGAAFTQMAIWAGAVLALGASSVVLMVDPAGLSDYGITPLRILFFLIYFVLGFFLYGAFSVGLGATVGQQTEIQQLNMLVAGPQVMAVASIAYVLRHPGAWPSILLSLFPPFTPVIMSVRMGAMSVPMWQLILSVVLMGASIWGVVRVASRIYRVGILMYGKRPNLREMVRWFRYS